MKLPEIFAACLVLENNECEQATCHHDAADKSITILMGEEQAEFDEDVEVRTFGSLFYAIDRSGNEWAFTAYMPFDLSKGV